MKISRLANVMIRKEPHYRRAAIEDGLKKLGFSIGDFMKPEGREDWLVLWNKKHGADETAANYWEQRGGTVIVMENGYLQKTDKTTYAISVHGHNGSGWFPIGDEDRFSKLGFEVKPWWYTGVDPGHILVCGQRGIGSSLMASPPGWMEKAVRRTGQAVYRPVRARSHPGNFSARTPLLADLKGAYSCFIWSSGAGVRALVEGVPVCYDAPFWICSDGAEKGLGPLDEPSMTSDAGRKKALHKMSHGQWHFEEIATGEPFARILDQLERAKWN